MNAIKPGLFDGLDEQTYHGHKDSLSVSGAKKLLPPSCPAIFKWERDNGQEHKAAFDFGHAAHAAVLGVGAPLEVVDADNWLTKAAKEAKATAYAEGRVPLLAKEKAQVDGMADAIKAHPIASALLDPDHGKPEVSVFWDDQTHGVMRRGRFDWLPDTDGGRLIIPDYKTAQSAEPKAFARAAANFNYHMQAAWYQNAAEALGLAESVAFVFIVQEKTAPYLVTVCELDTEAWLAGWRKNDQALQVYAECTATDSWPTYSDDVELISLPGWATYDSRSAA